MEDIYIVNIGVSLASLKIEEDRNYGWAENRRDSVFDE